MVRLILLLSPPASFNSGMVLDTIFSFALKTFLNNTTETKAVSKEAETEAKTPKKDKTKVSFPLLPI